MSVDPDLAETDQPYAYAGDDPVNNSDPSGQLLVTGNGDGASLCYIASSRTISDLETWAGVAWSKSAWTRFSVTWWWDSGQVIALSPSITVHAYNTLWLGAPETNAYSASQSIDSGVGHVEAVATKYNDYGEYGTYGDDWCFAAVLQAGGGYQLNKTTDVSGGGVITPGSREPCGNWKWW